MWKSVFRGTERTVIEITKEKNETEKETKYKMHYQEKRLKQKKRSSED